MRFLEMATFGNDFCVTERYPQLPVDAGFRAKPLRSKKKPVVSAEKQLVGGKLSLLDLNQGPSD